MASPSRVLVVDDDAAARRAYRDVFATCDEFELAEEVVDGSLAVTAYARTLPDIVLMDLQMPRMDGVEATRALCRRWPAARVVALTTFGARDHVVAALRAGASGYLVKGITSAQLLAALRQALDGEMPLATTFRRDLVRGALADAPDLPDSPQALTPREVELCTWLARGLTNRQIASRMGLSEGSVKTYIARACDKVDAVSRTQLLVRAIQLGAVDPSRLELPPT